MAIKGQSSVVHVDVEDDPRWELTQRVVHSPVLSRATQLRAILVYIVRKSIAQPEEPASEFEIAHRVLGRRSDFNPLDDSIVRVQVAQLRKRLDLYFSTEGKGEGVVITIPLGSYEPVFSERRESSPSSLVTIEADIIPGGVIQSEDPAGLAQSTGQGISSADRSRRWWTYAACLATLILGIVGGFSFRHLASRGQQPLEVSNPILRLIFAPNAVVNTVIADTSLVFLQNAIHSDISVGDYLDPRYPDNVLAQSKDAALNATLKELTRSRYTSLNDADVVSQSSHWGTLLGAKTYTRYARYLHVRDFSQGNFIIVGSRRGNPWVFLFEPSLNFVLEEDTASHSFHFKNRYPKQGELQTYEFATKSGGASEGYVDIAILPNLAGTGSVLLLDGLGSEANEAAANLIFKKDLPASLSQVLTTLSETSKVEILLRVTNLDKADLGWEIVSVRTSGTTKETGGN